MKQMFEINAKMPTLNELIKKERGNRYAGNELKKRWQMIVSVRIRQARLHPVSKAQWILYEYHEATKRRDKDNVSAFARKVINDALQTTGILPNDNNEYVAGMSEIFVYDKTDRVIVTLIDHIEEAINDQQGNS